MQELQLRGVQAHAVTYFEGTWESALLSISARRCKSHHPLSGKVQLRQYPCR